MEHSGYVNPLGYKPVGRLLVSYAVPSIISMLINALYNIVDQIFIGHAVGYLGNAATTVAFPLITVGLAISLLFGNGCASFISLRLGEKRVGDAEKSLGNMTTMLMIISLSFTVLSLAFLTPILRALGATDAILPYAQDYTRTVLIGQPFVILTTGFSNAIRADSSPKYSMMCMLVGGVANIGLDALFIFTFERGVRGAAEATVISQVISFVIAVLYFVFFSKNVHMHAQNLKLKRAVVGQVAALGLSSFATQFAATFVQIVMNNTLRFYGDASEFGAEVAISGAGIVMKISNIMIAILVGISIGAQPLLGFNYGAKNYARVRRAYGLAAGAASVMSCICWIAFMVFPEAFVAMFGDNTPLFVKFCVKCFHSFMLLMCVAGFQIISANYFQAVGHPAKAIFLSLTRQAIFLIPMILIFGAVWGLEGALYSGAAADGLSFLITGIFIIREMRRLKHLAGQTPAEELPEPAAQCAPAE